MYLINIDPYWHAIDAPADFTAGVYFQAGVCKHTGLNSWHLIASNN